MRTWLDIQLGVVQEATTNQHAPVLERLAQLLDFIIAASATKPEQSNKNTTNTQTQQQANETATRVAYVNRNDEGSSTTGALVRCSSFAISSSFRSRRNTCHVPRPNVITGRHASKYFANGLVGPISMPPRAYECIRRCVLPNIARNI